MKKYLLLLPAMYVCLYIVGCDKEDATISNEDKEIVCGSSMPSGYQCISNAGAATPVTFDIPEVLGTWDSDDFDFCVKYNSDGTGLITYKASGLSQGSTQEMKWGAMVNKSGDLVTSGAGTLYIVHESLEGTIDPQIASLSFKQSSKEWYGFDLVKVSSCSGSGGGNGGGTGGGGNGNGDIIFWTQSDHGCGPINVTINGQSGSITSYFSASPSCGTSGCANFTLPAGNYTYSAECDSYTWGPTSVTVTEGGCFKMRLN